MPCAIGKIRGEPAFFAVALSGRGSVGPERTLGDAGGAQQGPWPRYAAVLSPRALAYHLATAVHYLRGTGKRCHWPAPRCHGDCLNDASL